MKKTFLSFAFSLGALASFAQNTVSDSVTLGTSFVNDVYYNMATGTVATVDGTNWHLAFSLRPASPPMNVLRSTTILANEGRGVRVYLAPTNTWETLDTAGYTSWSNLHNSDTSWDLGALNAHRTTDPFDYGWGQYDMTSHDVIGSSLFLVKLSNTSFKKVYIEKLAYDTQWVFISSNIDGSDSVYSTINRSSFSNKLFAYHNLNTNETIDREPASNNWDLLFTRYGTFVTQFNTTIFSATTGVLHNPSVKSAKVTGKDADSLTIDMATFSENINTIGTDWKENPGPGQPNFLVHDSTAYFIKTADNKNHKLVFNTFEGSSTGKITFAVAPVMPLTGVFEAKKYQSVAIYPNPATSVVNIDLGVGEHIINLYDLTGKLVKQTISNGNASIDLNGLVKGLYFIQVDGNKAARLLVQ